MDNYDDFNDLLNDLDEDLISISYGAVREEIINQTYNRIIYMYTLYDNSKMNRYEQGLEDSYGNIDNIIVDVDVTSRGIEFEGYNIAKGEDRNKDEYLDYYIEEGIYQYSRNPVPPRPVSEWVIERLEQQGIIEKVIEIELKKRGWDIE